MTDLHCMFEPIDNNIPHLDLPYVRTLYNFDQSGNAIEFNGYWYALENERVGLPVQLHLTVMTGDEQQLFCRNITVTRHEFYEDTSEYTPYDPNDEESGICFFPTKRQKIWFI